MAERQRFATRLALITGAGAGIGRAVAQALAREGAHCFVTDVDGDAADACAQALRDEGGTASAARFDVTDPGACAGVLAQTAELGAGKLDVLINNAGLNIRADIRHLTDAQWETIRAVNLDGAFRLARESLPLLQRAPGANIVNISSIMAQRSLRQLGAYAVTKGAMSALTRALAVEFAGHGVRVNAVAPGFIETKLTERFVRNPMVSKALNDQTPLRRFGTPEDVAHAVAFLASDEAAFITGSEMVVDGGMTASL
ncbi:MAG: SDR family NAD(P)-dependent oxidoreductase [Pseudomonadota bacterium]